MDFRTRSRAAASCRCKRVILIAFWEAPVRPWLPGDALQQPFCCYWCWWRQRHSHHLVPSVPFQREGGNGERCCSRPLVSAPLFPSFSSPSEMAGSGNKEEMRSRGLWWGKTTTGRNSTLCSECHGVGAWCQILVPSAKGNSHGHPRYIQSGYDWWIGFSVFSRKQSGFLHSSAIQKCTLPSTLHSPSVGFKNSWCWVKNITGLEWSRAHHQIDCFPCQLLYHSPRASNHLSDWDSNFNYLSSLLPPSIGRARNPSTHLPMWPL